jgi:hypothetical protein
MTKCKVSVSKTPKRAQRRPSTVRVKTLHSAAGDKVRVLSVDANSATFGDDFLYVFKQNVKKAREENKARLGSTRGAPGRG